MYTNRYQQGHTHSKGTWYHSTFNSVLFCNPIQDTVTWHSSYLHSDCSLYILSACIHTRKTPVIHCLAYSCSYHGYITLHSRYDAASHTKSGALLHTPLHHTWKSLQRLSLQRLVQLLSDHASLPYIYITTETDFTKSSTTSEWLLTCRSPYFQKHPTPYLYLTLTHFRISTTSDFTLRGCVDIQWQSSWLMKLTYIRYELSSLYTESCLHMS